MVVPAGVRGRYTAIKGGKVKKINESPNWRGCRKETSISSQ